ncbi:MAG TPA: sugar phosphate isomerase/epimerase [Solirubrobacteraceae bacterium]|nr:sugar phosphate isomerase/epimerase [Solirubrobacteraceae bacterium]
MRATPALGPDDLVLCSGTVSRHTAIRDRLAAASEAGYRAVSLWGRDYEAARGEGYSDADLAALLEDHGLVVAELDPVWWWTPGAESFSIPPELDPIDVFRFGESELFHIGEALGARSVNAADVLGGSWGVDDAAASFAALCDRAAERGLLVHLEWLAWSRIPDLATALQVVMLADRPNGGLNVDMWHCARTGATADDLRAVPGDRVLAVQVDDGPAEPEEDLIAATLHERLLPGEGDFDLVGYLGSLRSIGSAAPVGVEVFSDELHASDPAEAALRAARATRALLTEVERRTPRPAC